MSALHAAAAAAGLQREWTDADGRRHCVEDAVLDAILARLDTAPPDQLFVSAEAGAPVRLPVAGAAAELTLEDGTTIELASDASHQLIAPDTIGYHRLTIAGRTMTLAVAPPRGPQPRAQGWGVAVQIPALRGAEDTAYGDFGTLAETAAALGRAGCSALAISPTHALFPSDPSRFSPYSPSTRLFHNVLLADPRVIGAHMLPEPAPELIDWQHAIPARLAHLRATFDRASDQTRAAVAAFRAARGAALEAHARFDALDETLGGGGWRAWPSAYHDPTGPAVQRFAADRADTIALYAFLQWLAETSLAEAQRIARDHMAIGLIADLAVGVDPSGSHGWSRRGDLLAGLTIGAPPDPLGPEGQNWGITTHDPFALARADFAPFIETIRTTLAHAGGIRIDHALGLDRLWVTPEGAAASNGAYLTMPGEHLKRIVAIEAHRAGAIVIAEDLGTVPPGFRDDLAARGMLGMRVLLFERDEDGAFVPPTAWRGDAVAMTGTHDTPTLAGWWTGRDIAWGRRLGRTGMDDADQQRDVERQSQWRALGGVGTPPAEAPLDTILSAVADAPVPLAIFPLEDVVGIEEQPNIPGTTDEHPNWRRRMPADSAALLASPDFAHRAAMLTRKRPG
jgi:4-alpha-glucanotransferase